MLAMLTKNPALEISDKESDTLARSLKNVMDQYQLKPNPRTMAWVQLAATSAAIYGPRIAVIAASRKFSRPTAAAAATVAATPPNAAAASAPLGTIDFSGAAK